MISNISIIVGMYLLWRMYTVANVTEDALHIVSAFGLRRYRPNYIEGTYDLLIENQWKYFFSFRVDLPIKKRFKPIVWLILQDNAVTNSYLQYRCHNYKTFKR